MACVARTHTAIIMRVLYMLYCTIALYYGTIDELDRTSLSYCVPISSPSYLGVTRHRRALVATNMLLIQELLRPLIRFLQVDAIFPCNM